MCGRFTLAERLIQLKLRFEINEISYNYKKSYNIAPTHNITTITNISENKAFSTFKWGIPVNNTLIINARSDKINSNIYYQRGIKENRCLIPANGFYEWIKSGTKKIPYYIKSKSESVITFAGFYQKVDETVYTTIFTTDANTHIAKIHSRMPVIIAKNDESNWLSNKTSIDDIMKLIKPYPSEDMESYIVNSKVNSIKNNSPDLIKQKSSLSNFF